MNLIFNWLRIRIDATMQALFAVINEEHSTATIARFAITFLDVWQAIIILNHNYWIPSLIDISIPIQVYTIYACVLAIIAIIALVRPDVALLSVFVFMVNWLMYMILGISGLWYNDPPRASAGFSFFVMFISISAFWRQMLYVQRDRSIRKRN